MTYRVLVNYGGFIGAEEEFEVDASNGDEAIELAKEIALDECSFEIIAE